MFTRDALFLKWSGGATKRAFKVLIEEYAGSSEQKFITAGRNLYSGGLEYLEASNRPHIFTGLVLGEAATSGVSSDGSENINFGTLAELKAAWAAIDLQVKRFDDNSYWGGEWVDDWRPALVYDPLENYMAVPVRLEEIEAPVTEATAGMLWFDFASQSGLIATV